MNTRQWSLWPNIKSHYHCNHDYEAYTTLHGALYSMGRRGVQLGTDIAEMSYDGHTVKVLWHRNFEAELRQFVSQVTADALQAVRQFHPLPTDLEYAVKVLLWRDSTAERVGQLLRGTAMMAWSIPNPLTKDLTWSYNGTVDERRTTYRWLALRDATNAASWLKSNLATAYVSAFDALTEARAAGREDCNLTMACDAIKREHNTKLDALALAETGSPITRPPADQPLNSHRCW